MEPWSVPGASADPSPSGAPSSFGSCGGSSWVLAPPSSPWSFSSSWGVSAAMFSAGLLGNGAALGLLLWGRSRRRGRCGRRAPGSAFQSLALALVLTDLSGTCLLSPTVLAAYGSGKSLVALDGGAGRLCLAFAFAMSFFALATLGCLGAMALERGLALGAPFLYQRLRGVGLLCGALPAFYALAAAFCALPLLGFGRYVQYCPGTWCFVQTRFPEAAGPMPSGVRGALAFSLLYAAVVLLLILAVLLCNLSAILSLAAMHRRGKPLLVRRQRDPRRRPDGPEPPPPPAAAPAAPGSLPEEPRSPDGGGGGKESAPRRPLSISQELDHLILLSIMTLTFAVCSLPFTIRAFMNSFTQDGDYKEDLRAMRFLSINSIIDPWVFIILRPSVLRLIRSVLCCRTPFRSRTKNKQGTSVAKPKPRPEVDICRQ